MLEAKREDAIRRIRECGNRLIVALSGGVDSAVLLALAAEGLGADNVLAVTGRSAAVPELDLEDARRVARSLGVGHELLETDELSSAAYRANGGDRCYHCRSELFEGLLRMARERGFDRVVYGAITDDLGDHRPGMQAAGEMGVAAPLLEAGLGKTEIRIIAKTKDLDVRDKPAAACLASRIPTGTEVTPERLAQVERAEAALRDLGFLQLRVRHHGAIARLELDARGMEQILDPAVRRQVVQAVREAGFRHVTVDLDGYRTGGADAGSARLYRIEPGGAD